VIRIAALAPVSHRHHGQSLLFRSPAASGRCSYEA
jgi:hypothetical protein